MSDTAKYDFIILYSFDKKKININNIIKILLLIN